VYLKVPSSTCRFCGFKSKIAQFSSQMKLTGLTDGFIVLVFVFRYLLAENVSDMTWTLNVNQLFLLLLKSVKLIFFVRFHLFP